MRPALAQRHAGGLKFGHCGAGDLLERLIVGGVGPAGVRGVLPPIVGDDALRLKVTLKNGDIIYDYLDPDTFIEIRREIQQFIRGSVRERVESLGSYKPVAGVMFAFAIASGSRNNPDSQTVTLQKIEVNVNIDPAEFALPESLRTDERKSGLVSIH